MTSRRLDVKISRAQGAFDFCTPFGPLGLLGKDGQLDALYLNFDPELWRQATRGLRVDESTMPVFLLAQKQINEYFSGQRQKFVLPLNLAPLTEFSRRVSHILLTQVPFATTISYARLAQFAGSPGAARAVGGVMARNPFPLLVPCHRVLGARGALTGFSARGGLDLKRQLLDFEAKTAGNMSACGLTTVNNV